MNPDVLHPNIKMSADGWHYDYKFSYCYASHSSSPQTYKWWSSTDDNVHRLDVILQVTPTHTLIFNNGDYYYYSDVVIQFDDVKNTLLTYIAMDAF